MTQRKKKDEVYPLGPRLTGIRMNLEHQADQIEDLLELGYGVKLHPSYADLREALRRVEELLRKIEALAPPANMGVYTHEELSQ